MIQEPKPSPIEDARSAEDAGRPPADLPKPDQAFRSGCGAQHPTAGHTTRSVLRFFEAEIAMTALLGVTAMGLWLARSPTAPVIGAPQSTASLSVPTVQPTEPVASAASVKPVAPSTASGARGEGQEEASPSVSPPGSAQKQAPTPERTHKKVAKTTVLRASAPIAIDQLYRQRAAERCAEGLSGLMCRQALRFELCDGKWTQDAQSGMEICRLNR